LLAEVKADKEVGRLLNAKMLLATVSDATFADFLGRVKEARDGTKGLHIELPALKKARKDAQREFLGAHGAEANASAYREVSGGIVRLTDFGTFRLTNFTCKIVEHVLEDDGVDLTSQFVIEGAVAGNPYRCVVPADEFGRLDWVIPILGPRAIVYPDQKEHARAAIQELSAEIAERRVHVHTGWRKVDGAYAYLHAGGAISAAGAVNNVEVRLHGNLSRYLLTLPSSQEQARAAVKASIDLLNVAPYRVTVPLVSAAWRAPLGPCDYSVYFYGGTGTYKSELTARAQQHYGPKMDRLGLPANFLSTGNSLEVLAFCAKDSLLTIDDFCPRGSWQEIAKGHALADRIFRAAGNHQGRNRLRADSSLQTPKAPPGARHIKR
jgi:hypothetical protein